MPFRSASTNFAAGANAVTTAAPAGVVAGDILLGLLTQDGSGATLGFPVGWTKVRTDSITNGDAQTSAWGWKVATGTDSYAFTGSTGNDIAVCAAAYSGLSGTPIEVSTVNNPNNVSIPTSPVSVVGTGFTTTNIDDVVWLGIVDTNGPDGTFTAPSGMTLRIQTTTSGNFASAAIADLSQSSAGVVADQTGTWTAAGQQGNPLAYLIALQPSGGGAPTIQQTENAARARPGRGPFSKRANGFLVSSIDAYKFSIPAALQGDAVDTAIAIGDLTTQPNIAQTDWGQNRNRPGRGPLSTGRFFLPSIDAFKTSQSAALQGAAADVVNAAGALTTAILMAGSASDSATATANLSTAIKLAVNAIATATSSGALTTAILLSGSASDSVIATGSLAGTAAALTGSATAIATAAGNLATQIQLVGAAIDTAIATGSITGGALLSGAAQAVAIAGGNLTTAIQLLGSAADQATAAGALSTGIKLSGSASDIVVATGSLAGNAAALVGAAQSIVTAIGILSTGIPLGGGAIVVASAQGSLLTSIQLLGAAQSAVIAHGALTTVALYYASALTLRVPRKDYTLSIPQRDFTVTLH